ncbi:MAG: aspartate aminotransferase family protein [Deltaproteobacteria bacterium]
MKNTLIKTAKKHLTPALVFHTDIVAKGARGVYIEGADNRRYMDFSSGLAVANTGHCNRQVVRAAAAQMKKLMHSGGIFYHEPIVRLAKRLSGITPKGIDMFFFSNSGAEAVEGAIKLARHATGRQGIIAFTGGFHGRTLGALSLTASAARYRSLYHPLLPSVFHAPYPYCYRCPMGKQRSSCQTDCFEYLKTRMLRHIISPGEVAAIIIEPVLGEGGYVVPPAEFLIRLRELCAKEGMLFIADEVQSGFGRTGKWFASEHFNLAPDIIAVAKGIASGLPLSAVGSSSKIMSKWPAGAHGTTFGGNPVSCAAAGATIEVIEKKKLLKNASMLGAYAMGRLKAMQERYPVMGDVRGLGLMIGIEFIDAQGAPAGGLLKKILDACLKRGLIIIECGIDKNIARLMPPLTTEKKDMDKALNILEEAVKNAV